MAAGLGAAVGLEREVSDQPAGLRTHLAVALGAALFGVVSTTGFSEYEATRSATNIQLDVTRVASLVASGIGFIGAGLIFRQGTTVRNLTTAASIWVVAAVGLSCGVGDFAPAVATVVVVLVALALFRLPRTWIRQYLRPDRDEIRVVLRPGEPHEPLVTALRGLSGVHVESVVVEKEQGGYVVSASVRADRGGPSVRELLAPLAHLDAVDSLTRASRAAE
ncbi:MAG TPA: MgtC/SapB family protein [Acidimicrobiales bacterium]